MRRGFSSTVFRSISAVVRPTAALIWILAAVVVLWVVWLFVSVIL